MSNGFNPLSMFKPTGNPEVEKLLSDKDTPIDQLLDQESFPTEFRREDHGALKKYMTYKKYHTLVEYITQVEEQSHQDNKNRGYKYPLCACEILSIDNSHTAKYFVSTAPIVEQEILIEEIEQEIDENDQSFMSSRSEDNNSSIISDESQAAEQGGQNTHNEENTLKDAGDLPEMGPFEKNASEIDQDDFPFIEDVKKTKKKIVKCEKVVTKEYPPLIEKLLQYFKRPINHTLTGYVCKVIGALLSKNEKLCPILLNHMQSDLFTDHLQSRSTEELIVRVCLYEKYEFIDQQLNLILFFCEKIFNDQIGMVAQKVSYVLCEVLIKLTAEELTNKDYGRDLLQCILKSKIFPKISKFLKLTVESFQERTYESSSKSDQETLILEIRIKELLKVAISFLDLMLKNRHQTWFKNYQKGYQESINDITEASYKKIEIESLSKEQEPILSKSTEQFYPRKFGMTKVMAIKLISSFIRQNLGFSQQILAEREYFFEILLLLVKNSPNSCILHHAVFAIFEFVLSALDDAASKEKVVSGTLLKQVLFTESRGSLLQFCQRQFEENHNLSQSERKSYIGQLQKICSKIYCLKESEYPPLKNFKQNKIWKGIVQREVHSFNIKTESLLGRHCKKRNVLAPVEFDKEKILEKHKEFLKGTKFMAIDEFENFDENQSDSEDGGSRRQISVSPGNAETTRQMEEMEIEEFYVNSGMQTEISASSSSPIEFN